MGKELERTWWTCKKLLSRRGMDGRVQVKRERDAILVSSLTTGGLHAPCFDFDFPVEFAMGIPAHTALEWAQRKLDGKDCNLICAVPGIIHEYNLDALDAALHRCGLGALVTPMMERHPLRENQLVTVVRFAIRWAMKLYRSSNPAHRHLYIDQEIPWPNYELLLVALRDAGLLEKGFADNSIERQMTMLLKPGLKKADLAELGVEIEEWSDGKPAGPASTPTQEGDPF